ncbi:hypothetical protein OC846_005085 [Tilletia horrida]|uniref:Uncharacterized protein n=1 Tax=Tilletia horrida TaxID=155126 RepID=A0AAN6GMG6_9BASI|nr:hypothetical protein OC846_005085 [Tilletia horrida]
MPLQEKRGSGLFFTEDEPPISRPSPSTRTSSSMTRDSNRMASNSVSSDEDEDGDISSSRSAKRIKKEHSSGSSVHVHGRGKENRPPLPSHLSTRHGPSTSTPRRTASQSTNQLTHRSTFKHRTPTGGSQQKLTAFYGFAQQPEPRPNPPSSSSKVKRANPGLRTRRSASPEKQNIKVKSLQPPTSAPLGSTQKGKARAQQEERRPSWRSDLHSGHSYSLDDKENAESSQDEAEPPSTWKQNAAKDMHIIRLLADRSREEDDVYTQVPGKPGQKVVRDLGRQLEYDERKKQKAIHDANAAKMRDATMQRLKGDTVRPFNTRRPLKAADRPGPSTDTRRDDAGDAANAEEGRQEAGRIEEPSPVRQRMEEFSLTRPLDSSDIDARINNLLKARGKSRSLSSSASGAPASSARQETAKPIVSPAGSERPHWKRAGSAAAPKPTSQRLRDVRFDAQAHDLPASIKKGVSFAAEVETQLADMASSSESSPQQHEGRSAPETMISESLLRLAEGHNDDDDEVAVEETTGAVPTRTPSRKPYITNYDLSDLKATVPAQLRHVLEPGTQLPFEVHEQLARAGERPGIREWLLPSPTKTPAASTTSAAQEDPDRTWVNEVAPPKAMAIFKQQTLGSALQILPSPREPEVQVETQEQMRQRFKNRAAVEDPRYDQATGTTEVLSDYSDDEDADKTRVEALPTSGHRSEVQTQSFVRRIVTHDEKRTMPPPTKILKAAFEESSPEDEMNPHADSIDSQLPLWPIGKATHKATIQAAKNFPDALAADETQLLPFSQEGSDTQEYAGTTSSESIQLAVNRSRTRFTKDGITQLDSQGKVVDHIRLPFLGSSSGSGSGSSP